jgi:hypothetical protein
MRPLFAIGFAISSGLIIGGLTIRYIDTHSNEELASKVEWSVVQAVSSQDGKKPSDKIEVVKMDDYSLVGIPVHDARKEIWIMLNSQNPPYYKQLPKGSYVLTEEDLKKILTSGVVTSTVENCLESHVESQ